MRIRKRKVPLPISLLSPIPLSDPHLFSQSPVHLHHPNPSDHSSLTSPSDLHPSIITITNPTSSGVKQEDPKQGSCLEFQGGGEGRGERISQKNNNDDDGSKEEEEVTVHGVNNNNGSFDLSPSNQGGGGGRGVRRSWSEGERVIPLKKRRPSESFFIKDNVDNDGDEKTVMTDGSLLSNEQNKNNRTGGGGGKQKRGTTIMEGSRCSRVNGRGWRCCQPTLVGYSLCEHHLGKGRLRSMTSVRGRPSSKKQQQSNKDINQDNKRSRSHDVVEKQQGINSNNKRVNYKLGVVKARSLSSLLGQTTNTPTSTTLATATTTMDTDNNVDRHISISISRSSTTALITKSDGQVVVN